MALLLCLWESERPHLRGNDGLMWPLVLFRDALPWMAKADDAFHGTFLAMGYPEQARHSPLGLTKPYFLISTLREVPLDIFTMFRPFCGALSLMPSMV